MNKKPNFFIVGAPKCGTTALNEYLKEHPNIFMSTPKEPHYFATDMVKRRGIDNSIDYFNLFKNVTDQHLAIGEASVWYLYSKKAIENIFNFNKNAKIIVMLRKPVDMIYSLHSQLIYSRRENEFDFEKAWELEEERKKGKSIPMNSKHVPNLFYSEIANYYTQLQNVYKYFPKNQVKVILFDDFIGDTKSVFNETISFLNLPPFSKDHFPIINENKTVKFKFINTLLNLEPPYLIKNRLKFKKIIGLQKVEFGAKIKKINTVYKDREPIEAAFKNQVIQNYKNEINKLASLLQIDLSNWNK